MTNNVLTVAFVVAGFALTLGCSGTQPTPTSPSSVVPACRTNNTATVTFENRSANRTYDILWDNARVTTLGPGVTSPSFSVAAGVQHTLEFRVSNTTTLACTRSTPTLAQCSGHTLSCGS